MKIDQVPPEIIFESGRKIILNTIKEAKEKYFLQPTFLRGVLYEALVDCQNEILSQQQSDYGKIVSVLENKEDKQNGDAESVSEN